MAGIRSARRSAQIHKAVAVLRKAGVDAELQFTASPGDGKRLAAEAAASGCDLIIACGGDGTINEVINGIAPGNTPLAILPGGTANIAAKELGLPGNIVRAARQLSTCRPFRVPLGRATWEKSGITQQRYFLAVAGIGFDAHIISQLNVGMKLRMGVLAYVWEAVRQIFHYGFPQFQFTADNNTASATFAVVQRSSRYAGWLRLARPHSVRDLGYSCCLFDGHGAGRYFRYALGILTQAHAGMRGVRFLSGSEIRCTSNRPETTIGFEVDGELAGRIPVTFEVVPDALTILAPESFSGAQQ
jgi:diacylglycerol kinase (ATP)